MKSKFLRIIFCVILFLGTTYATAVQAQATAGGSEGGGNAQTPVQVVVQIVVAAVVLRVLQYFELP